MTERKPVVDWSARGALALALLVLGVIPKVTGDPTMVANFARWGYPADFYLLVAAFEITGVVLLLVPRTVGLGALLVVGLMLGAVATHLRVGEYGFAPIPALLAAVAGFVGWPRWRGVVASRRATPSR
jgi:uncharacterized membrane protein YphA (DoxX/SURF4 family)